MAVVELHNQSSFTKYTDGAAVGGSKFPAAASKVAGAPLGSCRFVSMDATAKPSFSYGSRLTLVAERFNARALRNEDWC